MLADTHNGALGMIKAFRDSAYFRDSADGAEYLALAGSLAAGDPAFNGAIGLAHYQAGEWQLLPPLICANGVNKALERAHLVFLEGRYFAFQSIQTHTFAPPLRHAPTGFYGMVADNLLGPYRPLNGAGLILANSPHELHQTYSCYVDASLQDCSFVDFWGLGGAPIPAEAAAADAAFGGVPALLLRLEIAGDHCRLAPIAHRLADAGCD